MPIFPYLRFFLPFPCDNCGLAFPRWLRGLFRYTLETPTRKSYEQFLDDIAARGYTRFQANGPVLEVDVTDLSELDFPRLMGSLTGFVQRAVPGYPLRLPTRNAQSHRK